MKSIKTTIEANVAITLLYFFGAIISLTMIYFANKRTRQISKISLYKGPKSVIIALILWSLHAFNGIFNCLFNSNMILPFTKQTMKNCCAPLLYSQFGLLIFSGNIAQIVFVYSLEEAFLDTEFAVSSQTINIMKIVIILLLIPGAGYLSTVKSGIYQSSNSSILFCTINQEKPPVTWIVMIRAMATLATQGLMLTIFLTRLRKVTSGT